MSDSDLKHKKRCGKMTGGSRAPNFLLTGSLLLLVASTVILNWPRDKSLPPYSPEEQDAQRVRVSTSAIPSDENPVPPLEALSGANTAEQPGDVSPVLESSEEPVTARPLPSLPLAFHYASLDALGLDSEQELVVEELREQFISEIGGLEQDPADPAYGERWQDAQPSIDAALIGKLGRKAFLQLQGAD